MKPETRCRRFASAVAACLLALAGFAPVPAANANATVQESPTRAYIVVLKEAPLARYAGQVAGIPAPLSLPGKNRLDVRSPSARQYVDYLRAKQQATEASISRSIGRSLAVTMRVQHALNAIVTTLSAAEAAAVRRMPEVLLLDPVRILPLDTDAGPALIGAPAIWAGTGPGSLAPAQGEGTVIGVIDSGVNFGSPSFAAVDPIDGYTHVNPLGAGNFLGTCAPGGPDAGRCNAKLIGGYDFVCNAPVNACTTAGMREEPGFGDTDSHGSHTASTSAGNRRDVVVSSATRRIQGVAPRANLIAYDACFVEVATGSGLCPSTATVASVNQAVADGIVDVINFSISGGEDPWADATSLAFLGATGAGIYVATSAGNSGPGANTMGHHEPWTSSTAAAQHGRQGFAFTFDVTGPAPVPASLVGLLPNLGTGGVTFASPIAAPLRISAGINTASDGCAAYPANTFAGAIAVVRRGTCSFAIKTNNVAVAGAVAMILANNTAGVIVPSVPGTTIPVFSLTLVESDAIRDFGQANSTTATAQLNYPASVTTNLADQLAAFSSRGPAGNYDLVKPDVTAPGVNVLAVTAGATLTGFENNTGLLSGTSMASPHNAGAALLLRQLKPAWTVPEIKSALSMTTTRSVVKEDGTTAATPFDMGSGRIRVDRASNAGLLLNETATNFTNADPAIGGSPASLNLPSLGKRSCAGECQFVRTFRSPLAAGKTWNAAVTGLSGTVSPASFTVPAGGTVTLTITIDSSAISPDGAYRFGWVELAPQGGTADDLLTLPVAVAVPPPVVGLTPASQDITLATGATGTATIAVRNDGGFPLNYTVATTGSGAVTAYNTTSTDVLTGFRSTIYTDPATAGNQAQFSADDFTVDFSTTLRSIAVQGFVVSGAALSSAATNLTWSIYPDAGGLPAGNPQTNAGAALWTYTATPTSAGVSTVGSSDISLDLAAAGQNVTLPPGRYWVVVNTRGTFDNRYAWFGSNTGNGGFASIIIATDGTGNWAANPSFAGLTMQVTGTIPCGASWIGASTPSAGSVPGGASQNVVTNLSAVGLATGNFIGTVCISSNDAVTPSAASTIRLTVVPSQLAFTTTPSATAAAQVPFAQQPVVTAQDTGGATVTGYALPVTLSIASGTGTITCDTNPVQPVNGVATFTGCRIDALGAYTLRASTSGIANATTNPPVTVTAGAANRLAFSAQPGGGEAATAWGVQPSVTVQDAFGNPILDSTAPVTLAITTPDGATLACTANPVAATGGTASFAGCRIDKAGTYTLTATSAGLASATSASLAILTGPSAQLVFSTPPGGGPVGAAWAAQPVVSVLDAGGNRVAGATNAITLSIASGTGTLTCDANPVQPVNGIATFTGCRMDTVGAYTLRASTSGIANATTNPPVTITAGAAVKLAFTSQPGGGTSASPWAAQPTVTVQDASGNTALNSTVPVTLAITTPDGATLACTANPVAATGGTASFAGCRIDKAGTYTLTATSAGLASATSASLAILTGPPAQLVFSSQPGGGGAGVAWPAQPAVAVLDAGGNRITGATNAVTLTIASPTAGALTCTANPVNASAGLATFTGCRIDAGGTYTLTAAATGLTSALSASFVIGKLDQAITFAALADRYAGSEDFNVSATASSLLPVTIASDTPAVCAVNGTTVQLLAPGTCSLRATQAGDGAYNAATPVSRSFTILPATAIPRLVNISTRMQVLTGDNVLIGGFIIGGTQPKTVVVRARGPSLIPAGVPNALANPVLQLFSGSTQIAFNDNWKEAANQAALAATVYAPSNDFESAILTTLTPGAYTSIVTGANLTTGIAIVEVFEVDLPQVPLLNISTRGAVLTGNDVMIGGFIIQGDAPQTVIVRARGPSLAAAGVPGVLADPVLQLFSGQSVIAANDDWQASPDAATIASAGFAPSDPRESSIRITLNPGAYTAIVTGKNGTTGVGIIEVFAQ